MATKFGNAFDGAASPGTVRRAETRLHKDVDERRVTFPSWILPAVLCTVFAYAIYSWGWCRFIPFGPCYLEPDMPNDTFVQYMLGSFTSQVDVIINAVFTLIFDATGDCVTRGGRLFESTLWPMACDLSVLAVILCIGTVLMAVIVIVLYTLLLVCVVGPGPLVEKVRANTTPKDDKATE